MPTEGEKLICCYSRSLLTDDGESTIVCNGDYIVNKGDVNITGPLEVDKDISCSYTYHLTAEDVDNLERPSVVKVTGKDDYGYEVEASVTAEVSLSQVTVVHLEGHAPVPFFIDLRKNDYLD